MGKTKTKKFRGSMTHGRGKKAGRGAGLRGGRGMAGINKHRVIQKIFIERATNKPYWGRVGFKRPQHLAKANEVTNVGRLDGEYPGQDTIDLTAAGIDKLLGAGSIDRAVTVKVAEASASAVEKIEAAGGKVELTEASEDAGEPAES